MYSFKDYLFEATMTLDAAMKVFGITSPFSSENDLKTHYKKLALQNHPDHGGSIDKMKDINLAKEILSKNIGKKSPSSIAQDREKREQEYRDLKVTINNILLSKFNPQIYTKYLREIFGKEFKCDHNVSKHDSYFANMRTHLMAKFYDAERDIVFDVYFGVDLIDIKHSKGLGGSGNIDFSILVTTDAYVNGKKQKIARNNWNYTNDHNMFTKPEAIFPKAKMTKLAKGDVRKGSKLKRSDFDAFFIKKYGAKANKDGTWYRYYIPIIPGYELLITRSVMMRTPMYEVNHIAKGTPTKFGGFKYEEIKKPVKVKYFEESQETLDFFKSLIDTLKRSGDPIVTFQRVMNQ